MPADESASREDAMTLFEILAVLWRSKWTVVFVTASAVGLATGYLFIATDWYRAEVLLKPMDTRSGQGLSGQSGAVAGLASLAGVNIGNNPSAEALAVLTSRELTSAFIEQRNLLPILFAKQWDPLAKQWKSQDPKDQPDIRDGVDYFAKRIRTALEDKKTGLVTLTIEWKDARTAAIWANSLVDQANDRMRQRALVESENNVAFLKEEVAASSLVTLQQSIGRVLESELQKLMLAKANKEFAFRVIDHAEIPKYRFKPQRILILVGAFIVGMTLSFFIVIAQYSIRRNSMLSLKK